MWRLIRTSPRIYSGTDYSPPVSNASMFNPLWSILKYLPSLQLLFCLILTMVSAYGLFSATLIVVRLRSLATLHARSANLHQLVIATFYLFGFIFFLTLPFAFMTLGASKVPGWMFIFENLDYYFAFAANVFFVFLVLHSVQWFVSARVRASARWLNAQNIA